MAWERPSSFIIVSENHGVVSERIMS